MRRELVGAISDLATHSPIPLWINSDLLPKKYQEITNVLDKRIAYCLSKHQPYNCLINLHDDAHPPFTSYCEWNSQLGAN